MPATKSSVGFSRGEVCPSLYARPDIDAYAMGLRTCRNWYVRRDGTLSNRAGTQIVCEVNNSAVRAKLIPFIFNSDQTYILEFGNLYMRVVKAGAQVRLATVNITAITQASPGHVTSAAHGLVDGDEVYITGVVGMTQVNGRNFKVDVTSATEFDLYKMDGTTAFNTSTFTAYASGGTVAEVFQRTTPYVTADIQALDARSQIADVIRIFHKNYAPIELSRSSDTSWTPTTTSYVPEQVAPHGGTGVVGAAGSYVLGYRATAINDITKEESLAGRGATQAITNITQANPAVVTYAGADNFANGDEIFITAVTGMTQVNDLKFTVANLNAGANTFELLGINSLAYTAYSAGGTVALTYIRINAAAFSDPNAHAIAIPVVSGATNYNFYKKYIGNGGGGEGGGTFGLIGTLTATTGATSVVFYDSGRRPDESFNHPDERNPFSATGDYPMCGCLYQLRQVAGGGDNNPNTAYASRTARFNNFTKSNPTQADDAIDIPIVGRTVNRIRWMADVGTLILFTTGGETVILGDAGGNLTPEDINPRQQGENGSGDLPPLIVNQTAIYLGARGNKVRDLLYSFEADRYQGEDLTTLSSHLFKGFTVTDWAYQQNPESIIWVVRSDGVLLGLTYHREQSVFAWHRHDTDGLVENVCVVPEGEIDALYLVVKRTINGETKRYIERMASRDETDQADLIFVDAAITYDGRNTDTTNTVTVNAAGTTATFAVTKGAGVVGDEIHVRDADGALARLTIDSSGGALVWNVTADRTITAAMQVATADWGYAKSSFSGLWHLEGESVSAQGDSFVLANPNNESYTLKTVTNGTVSFDHAQVVVHVGLPFVSDLETLDIDSQPTLTGKKKIVKRVHAWVQDTRGLWMGPQPPTDDDDNPTEFLTEAKPRDPGDSYDSPPSLHTDTIEQEILGEWTSNGRVFIRQLDPVPATISAIAPDVVMG